MGTDVVNSTLVLFLCICTVLNVSASKCPTAAHQEKWCLQNTEKSVLPFYHTKATFPEVNHQKLFKEFRDQATVTDM
jgi:hypothetical protein